ncbi:MAG TPA: Yip1 family protein [Pseudogracilibacillus sp.]|nr:Yip1 family protein [Pseudogracilibacillus sp.]
MNEEVFHNNQNKEKPKLLGMLMQPSTEFIKIKQNPVIWKPLIIISILMMIAGVMTALNIDYTNDPEIQEAIQILGMDDRFMLKISALLAGVANLIIPGLTALITTVIYLVIAKVIKKPISFKQLYSMNTYILFISAIGMIANGLLSMIITKDPSVVLTSLAAVIQTDNMMIKNVLIMVEFFAIWGLVLTIIGLQKVAGFSKVTATSFVLGFYILSLLFNLFGGWVTTLNI